MVYVGKYTTCMIWYGLLLDKNRASVDVVEHQSMVGWWLGVIVCHLPSDNHGSVENQDHPRTRMWLITMVIISPQDLGLWWPK